MSHLSTRIEVTADTQSELVRDAGSILAVFHDLGAEVVSISESEASKWVATIALETESVDHLIHHLTTYFEED